MSRELRIKELIQTHFNTEYLLLENESHMHSVPENSETHFKLVLVSPDFDGKRKIARHQMIYGLLADEMKAGLHALALHTFTLDEWQDIEDSSLKSPNCMGGSKKDN